MDTKLQKRVHGSEAKIPIIYCYFYILNVLINTTCDIFSLLF